MAFRASSDKENIESITPGREEIVQMWRRGFDPDSGKQEAEEH